MKINFAKRKNAFTFVAKKIIKPKQTMNNGIEDFPYLSGLSIDFLRGESFIFFMERRLTYNRDHFTLNSDLLKKQVRAVALSLMVKKVVTSSVISDFNFRSLAQIVGISEFEAKVCFQTLVDMGLVTSWERNNRLFVRFENLKAKKVLTKKQYTDKSGRVVDIKYRPNESNDSIVISDEMDYQEVVKALYANIIRNNSKQLLYLQCNANRADLEQAKSIQDIHKAKSLNKKNSVEYWKAVRNLDLGLSYGFLSRKLRVGYNELSEIIKFGVKHNYFVKCVRLARYLIGKEFVKTWYRGQDDFGCQYAKGDYMYRQKQNLYLPIYDNGETGNYARKLYDSYCISYL